MESIPTPAPLFEVDTPLGFRVRVPANRWQTIITNKHPSMAGREPAMRETLEHPDEVRLSRSDGTVYLFYCAEAVSCWVSCVTKRAEEDGFLITAYPTDAIKEGTRIWPE